MSKNTYYYVLDRDNLEELAKKSGRTQQDLQKELNQSVRFGYNYVIWSEFNKWYGVRIDVMYDVSIVMRDLAVR